MPTSAELPYPPFHLANRVGSIPEAEAIAAYEGIGAGIRAEMTALLPDDWSYEGKRMLDFGCGAGRAMRHFVDEAKTGELWGVDIDAESIDWLNANLGAPLQAAACNDDPPLDFESGHFDLIWATSVFTHLSGNSAEWLLEMHRLLAPGGRLVATYMGAFGSQTWAGEDWDPDRVGMNVLQHNRSWDHGGPMVLMSEWWIREHWGRIFEIEGFTDYDDSQCWVALRKKDVSMTAEELLEPGDDPREWRALRHNITQLQYEIEQGGSAADFENSLSWRVTAPLRAAKRRAGELRRRS